jgi:hypothetical protein
VRSRFIDPAFRKHVMMDVDARSLRISHWRLRERRR